MNDADGGGSLPLTRDNADEAARATAAEPPRGAPSDEGCAPESTSTARESLSASRRADDEHAVSEALFRIGMLLAAELDLDRLVQRITDEATAVCRAQFGAFFYNVVDRRGESFLLYALSGAPREAFDRFGMPRNTKVFAPTFAGQGVVRVDDVTRDPRYGQNPPHRGMPAGHLPVVSYLAVPVILRSGEVVGGLFFGHSQPGVFTARDERVLMGIAAQAAVAIDNARMFQRLRDASGAAERRARQAALGADVGVAVTASGLLGTMLQRCTEALVRHLSAAFARIWIVDRAGETLELQASAGMYTRLDGVHARLRLGETKIGLVALEKRPHLSDDVQHDPLVTDHAWAERESMTSFAGYPLLVEGRLLGVMALFSREKLTQDALDALGSVADTIALGIERKRGEDALRVSEHRYKQILDSVQDMVFCRDAAQSLVYANRATCEYYGLPVELFAGTTAEPRAPTVGFTPPSLEENEQVFATGQPLEVLDEPRQRADGEIRFFHTVKAPVRDADGRVVELVGVSRDVTERRRAAEAQRFLADASAQLSSSLEWERTLANIVHSSVPTIADWCALDVLDADGALRRIAVAHVDPEKVALAHELYRKYPVDLNAPYGLARVLRTGESELIEQIPDSLLVAVSPDSYVLELMRSLGIRSTICVPLIAHGRVLGGLTLVSAESKRTYQPDDVRLAEELARRAAMAMENARLFAEVRRLNETLEQRVAERTAQLTEANRELEAFSYTVSHDLRAPIRHMSGFLDLLQKHAGSKFDAKAQRYVSIIGGAAQQMGTLIDALLAFSRMGRAGLTLTTIDLDATVRELLRELEPETKGRVIDWRIGPLGVVTGDATLLRLAFANLLGNAVKYTRPRAEATIEVFALDEGNAGERVFAVRDNGVGFNMAYVDKLFGVFQRLHGADRFEGTGIGLANVRRIVQRHGGRAWAVGREDHGATFYLALPQGAEPRAPQA